MTLERPFRPGFARAVGSCFVLVDQVQPVAISVSPAGEVLDVIGWADSARPVGIGTRVLAAGDGRIFITDRPPHSGTTGTPAPLSTIAVAVDPSGRLSASVAERSEIPPQQPRDRRSDGRTIEERQQGWTFRSHLEIWDWRAEALHGDERIPFTAPARLIAQAVRGGTAVVCVQRENKRPWPFRPRCGALLLTATERGPTSAPVPDVDIADRCGPRRRDEQEVRRELAEYAAFSRGQLRAAVEVGARDAELVVRGSGLDTEIELRFRLDEFPGTVFCRRDVPFDESGAVAGLRALNIALDEDIELGIRRGAVEVSAPVTWI